MAKAPKSQKSAAPAITLAQIVAAGAEGMFTPATVHGPMVEAGTVEINSALVDAEGNVATRATQKGIETVTAPATQDQAAALQTPAPKSAFAIEDGVALPTISGRGRTGTTYPFEQLAVGQSFFVPNDAKKPNAAKSLASTVSSATARYAEATGATKKNKAGEDVPEMKPTRTFVVRSVEGGARIWRTA